MNAIATNLSPTFQLSIIRFTVSQWIVAILSCLLVVNAFGIIYNRDLNRRLFSELQALYHEENELRIEWGQLVLEQSTWSTQARVQHEANSRFDMIVPDTKAIVIIQP